MAALRTNVEQIRPKIYRLPPRSVFTPLRELTPFNVLTPFSVFTPFRFPTCFSFLALLRFLLLFLVPILFVPLTLEFARLGFEYYLCKAGAKLTRVGQQLNQQNQWFSNRQSLDSRVDLVALMNFS